MKLDLLRAQIEAGLDAIERGSSAKLILMRRGTADFDTMSSIMKIAPCCKGGEIMLIPKFLAFSMVCALMILAAAHAAALESLESVNDEFAVYAAALDKVQKYSNFATFFPNKNTDIVFVFNTTEPAVNLKTFKMPEINTKLSAADLRAVEDNFREKNLDQHQISSKIKLNHGVAVLVPSMDVHEIDKGISTPNYPRSHVGIGLSRVGFDPKRQLAMIAVIQLCGTLCGEGELSLYEKQPSGEWQFAERLQFWAY